MSRILVIDDEEWLREMVTIALSHKGFQVSQAENGAIGIEKARKELPDLILCDVNMGKVDGYLTLASLRNEPSTAAIPFILMTGLADNAGMRHGMELGADDYLAKPFTLDNLFAAVDARLKKVRTVRSQAEKHLEDLRSNISLMLPHELRTPLNGIVALSEMIAANAASLPPEEIADMGRMIHDSSTRLERLIENFLIYAQIELLATDRSKVQALRETSTGRAIQVITARAEAQAAKSRRAADLQLDLEEVPISISEEHLGKVVDELVHNAFKFSPESSAVRVELRAKADSVEMHIYDSGRGFSTEHINRVGAYMQFDRKMHEQQGLGLGLAIAKRLVELYGGSLIIKSENSLTDVFVRLPRPAANEARSDGSNQDSWSISS